MCRATTDERKGKKSRARCCFILIVFLLVGALVGVGIWQLLPEETKSSLRITPLGSQAPTPAPTTMAPTVSYQPTASAAPSNPQPFRFNRCDTTAAEFDPNTNSCCNGLEGLCDFAANDIRYGFVHNAAATEEDGFDFLPNHDLNLEKALEAGFRGLELDVGRCNAANDLVFFHSSCSLGTRPVKPVLEYIDQFLEDNPTEVIVLTLQMPQDPTVANTTNVLDVILSVPGLVDRLYQHPVSNNRTLASQLPSGERPPATSWPTLGELVSANQRLILFYHGPPRSACHDMPPPVDIASATDPSCPYGFIYWFDFGVNTVFDMNSLDELNDFDASCVITTPGFQSTADWFHVNSFSRLPSFQLSQQVNQADYAATRAEECSARNLNRTVNLYSVDFWHSGNLLEWVQAANRQLILQASQ